jgi:UDP-glucose 4-epimerase
MKILVTGGAGYIGSHAVKRLIEDGHDVVIVDSLSRGYKELIHPKADFYDVDLLNYEELNEPFSKNIDAVMHFAAFAYVGESVQDPLLYYKNNMIGATNLLTAMKEHGIKNIVFSSSCATYGEPEQIPITEQVEQRPINPYGETKLWFEKMLNAAEVYGITSVKLRYFNVAGCAKDGSIGEMHEPETHIIPIALEVAAGKRESFSIFGTDYDTPDGTCIRDYVYVEDLVDAHVKALEYLMKEKKSNAFNLASGSGYSVREIIKAAEEVTGKSILVKEAPRRAGDPPKLVANATKAKEILGWEPQADLKEMIETAWFWMQRHSKNA